MSLDIETRDDQLKALGIGVRRGGYIVGVAFAIEDGPVHYLPIRHEGGDNLPLELVLRYLRDQLKWFTGELVGANFGYDLDYLWEELGEECFAGVKCYRDVQVAEPILDQLQIYYNLDAIANRRGLPGKDDRLFRAACAAYGIDYKNHKKFLWRLPARYVGPYAEQDARLNLQILDRQERELEAKNSWEIWEMETKVLPILVRMRRRGVQVNLGKIDRIDHWAHGIISAEFDEVYRLSGVRLAVGDEWKADALAVALKKAGYVLPKTAGRVDKHTGLHIAGSEKDSVTKNLLPQCGELGAHMLRAREFSMLRRYCAQVHEYQIKGRVHCTFKQLRGAGDDEEEDKGTRWGRMSSTDFNVQAQPVRNDEYGEIWRDVYEPNPGCLWVTSDWSQQEPRWAVHYAEILKLPGAKEFADRYRADPALDIHQALADISGLQRKIVKNYVNGRIYGMGDVKLCYSCGWAVEWGVNRRGEPCLVPGPEGRAKIEQFDRFAPWVRGLVRAAADRAREVGYVLTADGRRCEFPRDAQGNVDWTHKAFNRVGQGTAAGQAKRALIEAESRGIEVQLAVHDEFDFSCDPNLEQAAELKEIQLTIMKCNVPHMVDSEVGPSWGCGSKVYDFKAAGKSAFLRNLAQRAAA